MLSAEELQAHIDNGDRRVDVAAQHGLSRTRITQLVKLYELDWPITPRHLHGPGRRPSYRRGCQECRDYARTTAAARRGAA